MTKAAQHFVEVQDWATAHPNRKEGDRDWNFKAASGYVSQANHGPEPETSFGALTYDQVSTLRRENAYYAQIEDARRVRALRIARGDIDDDT